MSKNIVLIGFMGSGKSTVGRHLARRLGYGYVDTDRMIEAKASKTVGEIFDEEGEVVFRALERQAVDKATAVGERVVACGGGAVIDPVNVVKLKRSGILVYLQASEGTLMKRLRRGIDRRPLLRSDNAEERVKELLEERVKLYESVADEIVDTDGLSPAAVADEITRRVKGGRNDV